MSYYIPDTLKEIAKQVRQGQHPAVTVRMLLSWFGGQRREKSRVRRILEALDELKIKAEPEIEGAYIDGLVSFLPAEQSNSVSPEGVPGIGELPAGVLPQLEMEKAFVR